MAHVYGQDWYKLLKKYGGQDPGPMPFQGRALVPAGPPQDPVGAPPASSAVVVASPGVAKAPAVEPEAFDLKSHESDDVFSQGSWVDKSATEIREMLRDYDPDLETVQQYEAFLVRVVAVLELRGEPMDPRTIARHAIRASYLGGVAGLDVEDAGKKLRAIFSDLLQSGESLSDANLRAEILLDLVSQYGGESGMLEQLLKRSKPPTVASGGTGGAGSAPLSQPAASTPDKSVRVDAEVSPPPGFATRERPPVTTPLRGPSPAVGGENPKPRRPLLRRLLRRLWRRPSCVKAI